MEIVKNEVKNTITKQEFCKICGISQSTAYKLIKSKKVKFEKCRDGLLHYYSIPISEAYKFLDEKHSKNFVTNDKETKIKRYYLNKMLPYSDVIESKDIQKITGYGKEIIRQWINSEKILGVVVRKRFKVAKIDLLDFIVSPYYYNIIRKSQTHIDDFKNMGLDC